MNINDLLFHRGFSSKVAPTQISTERIISKRRLYRNVLSRNMMNLTDLYFSICSDKGDSTVLGKNRLKESVLQR